MPNDGLRKLPDHVVAPLLRALMCIPRTPDNRLILKPAAEGRPPNWDKTADFDVLLRGRRIGRVWRFDYTHVTSGPRAGYPWHWYWRSVEGRDDAEGDAPTLEAAMADFRRAWDRPAESTVA